MLWPSCGLRLRLVLAGPEHLRDRARAGTPFAPPGRLRLRLVWPGGAKGVPAIGQFPNIDPPNHESHLLFDLTCV